jgi:colanic acid/amylovoran biosynthesis glycosyltransferase
MNPSRPDRATTPVRLLSIGRLIEKKGFDDLLRICAALREAGIPFECRIAGGGLLRKDLETLTQTLGLADSVRLLGPLSCDRISDCYRWTDLFCFAGRIAASGDRDGLPNVIPEAMAHGVPVLAAPVSGVVEAVEDGVNGRLIDPSDVKNWVQAIDAFHRDEIFYNTCRRQARCWVEENYDARKNALRLLEALRPS